MGVGGASGSSAESSRMRASVGADASSPQAVARLARSTATGRIDRMWITPSREGRAVQDAESPPLTATPPRAGGGDRDGGGCSGLVALLQQHHEQHHLLRLEAVRRRRGLDLADRAEDVVDLAEQRIG